ncbi:MAG: YfdX family protein [Octadecabacter sp.]
MKNLNKMMATGMVAALGATMLVPLSATADTTTANTAVTQEVVTASEIAVSGTGRNVLTGIEYAKAAIDQGQPDVAKDILAELTGMFGDQDATVMMKVDDGFVLPLDTGLTVAEGFVPTDAHIAAFSTADALMSDGNVDQVITTLTDAGVDLVAQIALLPYTPTVDALTQAATDLDAGQLDSVTSTLDAIQASVHIASFAPDALPTQGYAMSDITAG